MLKEEMEKQLGVKVSNVFYLIANGMYEQGPYRNNYEFCEMLKHDKLLMVSLRESARLINGIYDISRCTREVITSALSGLI